MGKELGFNFFLTLDSKLIGGETQTDLSVTATEKTSLTKADKGNAQTVISGHEVTFTVNGAMVINDDGSTESIDADTLLDYSLRTGDEAILPFVYNRGNGKKKKGNLVITSYSESTNAEGEATFSLGVKVSGAMIDAQ